MNRTYRQALAGIFLPATLFLWGLAPPSATALTQQAKLNAVRSTGVPDYNGATNWAYSPPLNKFVDTLPGICGEAGATNALGQCIPVAVPDKNSYPGSDYYELEIVQYRERMHSFFPVLNDADKTLATTGGTLLRGYRQANTNTEASKPHYLGPLIVAQKDRPVRIKFTNKLPTTALGGDLFIPTDTTVMGSGPGPLSTRTANKTDAEICQADPASCFTQNRADLHLHGGRTPWISDGTAHQWITPKDEIASNSPQAPYLAKGVSVAYVPDMWFDSVTGAHITNITNPNSNCAGKTSCGVANAANNPGPGSQTYYWTNAQSARMMFYHDHSWGITRLGVYAGGAAGYLVTDPTEAKLQPLLPPAERTLPLIIQDKTFVDATTIINRPDDPLTTTVNEFLLNGGTDPTWIWGSTPGTLKPLYNSLNAAPVTGDLWWPHVYVPAQNPFNPNMTGINDFGRWHYGPWFWPPVVAAFAPIANPYYQAGVSDNPAHDEYDPNQPPEIVASPNPSWGAEAFLDTPVINGTAYPKLNVTADTYRFRILNAAHDRFWNLQLYVADPAVNIGTQGYTEVAMVPAVANTTGFPELWPTDGREGGVPNPDFRGPAMVQIGTEGGFLPAPVVLPNQPVNWNVDPTTFMAGLVLQQNQGGGTLMLGPAERADVIIDFSQFAGKTLILYNDAPAPWPALDPHYDYYTGDPDNTAMGGAKSTLPGKGPNTRTIMQIVVAGTPDQTAGTPDAVPTQLLTDLQDAFRPVSAGGMGIFDEGQEPIIVGQTAYNATYGKTFPASWPNWGLSRITDTAISFMTPQGATVSKYPMEPKAIQDEMGEVFDDFGRMSAKLGLELAKTTANIQTFVLQNFVDPATEIVKQDQIQIWKITHNGVDTHPVHFHLFEVQLLNRVGWDGFMHLPDPNELGWKDTIRISPLQDTIVALRPAKIPVPFNVPNSLRPLNPAYPLGVPAGFTNLDPKTAQAITPPRVNEVVNFGHEYLWHCHILSHEEQDMMRPIILNANSLLYTLNGANGLWQWDLGKWSQITPTQLDANSIVTSGSYAFAKQTVAPNAGTWQWDGYTWKKISTNIPTAMTAANSTLYASFGTAGLYQWKSNTWTKINSAIPTSMVASDSGLYANLSGGLYFWNGRSWFRISGTNAASMVASGSSLYYYLNGNGIWQWNGVTNKRITTDQPNNNTNSMLASGSMLYVNLKNANGLYQWDGSVWKRINASMASNMVASKSTLYASFTGGLYEWNGVAWKRLDGILPTSMVASGTVLYANYNGDLRKWEFGKWNSLNAPSTVSSLYGGY